MASRPTRSRSQSGHDIFAVLEKQAFSERLWRKDPTVWRQGPKGARVIRNRLGWLNAVEAMMPRVPEITRFADDIKEAGFTHVVLLGMGGSSLSPEVSHLTFGVRPGYPHLMVLDSTVPTSVLKVEGRIDPARTLFIVAMKSGATVETNSCYRYFLDRVRAEIGDRAGDNFVAITDPGTSLEAEAHRNRFRDLFLNVADIGGRYSALSYFGLVPAAIIGVDIARLLDRAVSMTKACRPEVSLRDNPGIALGAMLAEHAMQGRNKMTLVLSPEIRSFGCWVEQLVAESTGKDGTGILPVEGESIADPGRYGRDRVFVYLRLKTSNDADLDRGVQALEESGKPVLRIELDDVYDLGKEYFRWEMATAVASALLGVNAFDEPNVKESKDNTRRFMHKPEKHHMLPKERPIASEGDLHIYCSQAMRSALDSMRAELLLPEKSLSAYLKAFLNLHQPGNYFALMAFMEAAPSVDCAFQCMRGFLRDAYKAATTLGYGPRFLHSTGQFHKGGPNNGLFIQFTADDEEDIRIPGRPYGFGTLKQAQAMGDAASLQSKGRTFMRIHLGSDVEAGLNRVLDIISQLARIIHEKRE